MKKKAESNESMCNKNLIEELEQQFQKTSSFNISPASSACKHAPVIERSETFDIPSIVYRGIDDSEQINK